MRPPPRAPVRRPGWARRRCVDNAGDFHPTTDSSLTVIRPGRNLGWLRGTNAGLAAATESGCSWLVALNNDTRLSAGFFAGLGRALQEHPLALVAPCYDDHLATQNDYFRGSVADFRSESAELEVPIIDGTCFALTRDAWERTGPMDEAHFGRRGWGGIEDYVLRTRRGGGSAVVTRRSYLVHQRGSTAHTRFSSYERYATSEMRRGLRAVYGPAWRSSFAPVFGDHQDDTRTVVRDLIRHLEDRLGLSETWVGRR